MLNKTPSCQHQNFFVKSLRNSCSVPLKTPMFSFLKTEVLLYFIKIGQMSPNMWILLCLPYRYTVYFNFGLLSIGDVVFI